MIVDPRDMPLEPIPTGMTLAELYRYDAEAPIRVNTTSVVSRENLTNYLETQASAIDPQMTVLEALDTYGDPPPNDYHLWNIAARYNKRSGEREPVNIYSYGEKPTELTPFAKTPKFSANDIIVESASDETLTTANTLYAINGLLHLPERFTDYHVILRDAFNPTMDKDFIEDQVQIIQRSTLARAPAINGSAPLFAALQNPSYVERKFSLLPSVNYGTQFARAYDTGVDLSGFKIGVVLGGLFFTDSTAFTYDTNNPSVILLDFNPPSNILGRIVAGLYGRVKLPITPAYVDEDKKEVHFRFDDLVSETFIDWLLSRENSFIMSTRVFPGYQNETLYPVSEATERTARPFRVTLMDEVGLVYSDALERITERGVTPHYTVSVVYADLPDVTPVDTSKGTYSVLTI